MIMDYKDLSPDLQCTAGDWANWTRADPLTMIYWKRPVSARAAERAVRTALETELAKKDDRETNNLRRLLEYVQTHVKMEALESDIARAVRRALDEGLSEWRICQVVLAVPGIKGGPRGA